MPRNWVVVPTCLPVILRRCRVCACGRFRASGRFRLNAHHKLIDVWLLALCTGCGETVKLTVLERTPVRSLRPELLDRLHHNDPVLTAELLQDPRVRRRQRIALDWDGAWRVETGGPDPLGDEAADGAAHETAYGAADEAVDVSVRFAAPIPLRPVRLIAEGFGLSRTEVRRLIAEGRLVSAVRLSGRLSGDFAFTLKR
ncbi:DUF1062 domain-containing protein [Streptomyces sp. Amel2xB2]|uniref:DUF1062 domain-containing protein n=1 Tax=Streptomyces sp. Amel2xB2 TaxID=1305829 RepID=UPI000DBA3436|nr:DUF1062 domain-containing protein [Streptomyces sp. Amel2xB2]